MIQGVRLLLLVILAGCASAPSHGPYNDQPLPADDWRQSLLGTWKVEFGVDSVRSGGSVARWERGSFRTVQGTLQVRDTITGRWTRGLRSEIDVKFDDALGRPMSCFDPRPVSTGVERRRGELVLLFTPDAADCGFNAHGKVFGDSVVGTWYESSFGGPSVMGRFRMSRVKS